MGPRSEDRGNTGPIGNPRQQQPLQWGRGLKTAEMSYLTNTFSPSITLQWGRGLKTAEILAAIRATLATRRGFNGAAV